MKLEQKMETKVLYPNCSEVCYKLTGFTLSEEHQDFITKLVERFQPYDDSMYCGQFGFYDEFGEDEVIIQGRDDSCEESFEWMEKEAKKLKIKPQYMGEKAVDLLFAENNHLYYKQAGQVYAVDLSYSNIEPVDKLNKELLKIWERSKINEEFKKEQEQDKIENDILPNKSP